MPKFSNHSKQIRATLHPRLQALVDEVIRHFDCRLIGGFRDAKTQHDYFVAGKSMVDWPHSKHNKQPSEAVDMYPHPINWNDRDRMYYFAGWVMALAARMGIGLRWGCDWDKDTEVLDNIFDDVGHFELS